MKKIALVLAVVLCLVALALPFSGFAETKNDVLNALEKAIPKSYQSLYLRQAKNLLSQVDLSSDQSKTLIDMIDDLSEKFTDKGASLHNYSKEEVAYFLDQFDEAMSIMGLTYKFETTNKHHEDDVVCHIYKNSKEIIKLDGEVLADKTDAAPSSAPLLIVAGAFLALSVGAFVITRKKMAVR